MRLFVDCDRHRVVHFFVWTEHAAGANKANIQTTLGPGEIGVKTAKQPITLTGPYSTKS